jgi:hypothetical protein
MQANCTPYAANYTVYSLREMARLDTPKATLATGTAFVVAGVAGFILSTSYGLVSGFDEALGPPWVVTVVFVIAVVLARRKDRWGLGGTVLMILLAGSYLFGGQVSDPITGWAYGHNVGFAAYISIALLAAAAVVVATALELWVRVRNQGRVPT